MSVIHWFLGVLILTYERFFSPKGVQRSFSEQTDINAETRKITLYQYKTCRECLKVRFAIKRLSLKIRTRDIKLSDSAREDLLAGGGSLDVPCLRIEQGNGVVKWLYGRTEIIAYLDERFGAGSADPA